MADALRESDSEKENPTATDLPGATGRAGAVPAAAAPAAADAALGEAVRATGTPAAVPVRGPARSGHYIVGGTSAHPRRIWVPDEEPSTTADAADTAPTVSGPTARHVTGETVDAAYAERGAA